MNIQHICTAMDKAAGIAPKPKQFVDMNALEQRREIAYYLMDQPDRMTTMMATLMDWIDPKALFKAWQSADTAKVWQLVDRALAHGLEKAIDKANGVAP